jgi:aryl-alcohol dehydrogenase-like predicted oxidoreductase
MEYSLWTRDAEHELLPMTEELGMAFVPYSPLGRGFLTGAFQSREDLIPSDRRHQHPRFQEGNFERNLDLLGPLGEIAHAKGCGRAEVALAWLLSRGERVVPIPGTKRRRWLEQNARAVDLSLSLEDIARLESAFPLGAAAGTRYPEAQLKTLLI